MAPVIFFMLDGVRPDALSATPCPHLTALRQRGAASLTARSTLPCITLPCHTSIFHSVPPTRHGITTNEWRPMARPLPGLFEVLAPTPLSTAFFFNWEPLRDLSRPGSVDFAFYHNGQTDRAGDDYTADEAARRFRHHPPDFAFVYFGTIDAVGHDHGWMSPEYLHQLTRVDAALGRVLAALPSETTVLAQADHGGHARDHGLDIPEDMTIPWLIAGPGIRAGHTITAPVDLLSTAPTLARVLGLTPPSAWEGRAPEEIFVA